jgi:hypothetical protein
MSRILRLTLLAPKLVDAIPDGHDKEEMILQALMKVFPVCAVIRTQLAGYGRNPTVMTEPIG